MTADVLLALTVGVLAAIGIYLMMSKNLIKVMIGFLLIGHGTNVLLLSAGAWGAAPILDTRKASGGMAPQPLADPLPQAFVLTSIVITVAVACFLLAVVYRQYVLTRAADLPDEADDELASADAGGAE